MWLGGTIARTHAAASPRIPVASGRQYWICKFMESHIRSKKLNSEAKRGQFASRALVAKARAWAAMRRSNIGRDIRDLHVTETFAVDELVVRCPQRGRTEVQVN
jgi:hypothetical protein